MAKKTLNLKIRICFAKAIFCWKSIIL